ncbi:MAG TPA: ATP-binding protein [Gemmatimonadaceae bacterium]|nr:ATP-binding protein [Gemmatimonadaceae bacterium]
MPASAALAALGEIAARLASSDPFDRVCPDVLAVAQAVLGATELSLWRRADGRWAIAPGCRSAATAREVGALAAGAVPADGGRWLLPLVADGWGLGALLLVRARPLDADEHRLGQTVANLLVPSLVHAEVLGRLGSEVAARTQQIEDERYFTQQVIDSLPLGVYVIDSDYRIQLWNRKRETGLQGVSRDEVMGRTIFEVLHRQPTELLRQEFDEVLATGHVQQFHVESTATGELRHHRLSKIPMRLAGGAVTHIITIGEDVTEWRQAQERFAQAEKLAAIGQLAAGVMHEINNPLATIAACAESLDLTLSELGEGGTPVPALCSEYLGIVESEVQRCKRIVERLLQYSRPTPWHPEPVNLNDVVEQTLFLLKHHARFKLFPVVVDVAQGQPPVVRGNAEQLVQVLMALLFNAMDAMDGVAEPRPIQLRTRTPVNRDTALLEVQDHGQGMSRAELSKVFEPFYTTKAPGRGTGLGLSICYGIVVEHGGTIEAESAKQAGTTFRVSLPLVRSV